MVRENKYRSHSCGELRASDAGKEVRLAGWVERVRNLGSMVFFTLRDHYGRTQIFHQIEEGDSLSEDVKKLKPESVVFIKGDVRSREGDINKNMATGEIEIELKELTIDSIVENLPFPLNDIMPPEEMRLKYRFIDLRRDKLQENMKLRANVLGEIRAFMNGEGFTEIQTPILTASSPEGARDYVVPSRIHPGEFYALPQAPQQYKQILMCSGIDKYYQIAPCFRDEDARADRSPGEFYQLDLEMAFPTQDQIFEVLEGLFQHLTPKVSKKKIVEFPFPRITFKDAMEKYGSDKPDIRFGMEITNLSDIFEGAEFKAFAANTEKGKSVRGIKFEGGAEKSRKYFDKLEKHAKKFGAKGLAYVHFKEDEIKGSVAKFLSDNETEALCNRFDAKAGDSILIVAGDDNIVLKSLGALRLQVSEQEGLTNPDELAFCWIVDFPMFEWNEDEEKVDFSHNPFSMPQGGMEALETMEPLDILAYQYDLVCNGIELSSGAIRNHRPDIMYKAFDMVGYGPEVVNEKFGHMIDAFKFGAPPHGGIAPGLDRMVMIYADEPNIREVIAFPMNQKAQELMMGAPAPIEGYQMDELSLKVEIKEEEE